MVDTGLTTSTVITEWVSIAALVIGAGLSVGIGLSETSILFYLATTIPQKSLTTFTKMKGKYDATKMLVQSKLGSIADIVLLANQDADILSTEFHKVLEEVKKYHTLKIDIRNQEKSKVRQLEKEQQEELIKQGRKKSKDYFLQKITSTS